MHSWKYTDNKWSYSAISVLLNLRLTTLHGVRSRKEDLESSKIGWLVCKIQTEIAESEAFQREITKGTIQATTVAGMAMKEADAEPTSCTSITNVGEVHRPRNVKGLMFNVM